ncbi:methyltransferase domain-containing protein [Clostridium chrysemydis]|uniref:methyltransferase domain-containing protein n=1 Tax=Clostridium chrysemydis TaxID=2665504 RepID=UPI0018840AA8|nr:methyltransferase domain-containing protein [Clostridium chrysemydis]
MANLLREKKALGVCIKDLDILSELKKEGYEIYLVTESVQEIINFQSSNYNKVYYFLDDYNSISFKKESFDIAILINNNCPMGEKYIKKIYSFLKKEGILYILNFKKENKIEAKKIFDNIKEDSKENILICQK